jgi:hypothetical protein
MKPCFLIALYCVFGGARWLHIQGKNSKICHTTQSYQFDVVLTVHRR